MAHGDLETRKLLLLPDDREKASADDLLSRNKTAVMYFCDLMLLPFDEGIWLVFGVGLLTVTMTWAIRRYTPTTASLLSKYSILLALR